MDNRTRGFTIVELLIVIVVIGVLAGIVIVAYNGVQQSARDAVVKSSFRDFTNKLASFTVNTNGTYPVNTAELESLDIKINRDVLATSPTVDSNALYCTANGGADYVYMIYTKDGKMYYLTKSGSGEFTGSNNWNQSNYGGHCSNVLPGSASNAYSGYNSGNPGDGWADWVK